MCDFHSICCRIDGAIAHAASNSHSEAAETAGWLENDVRQRYIEAEWDGNGDMPPIRDMIVSDVNSDDLNERQVASITAHYRDLAETLRTGIIAPRFDWPHFSDVRYRVAENPSTPAAAMEMLSRDADEWVRWRVAGNPSAPAAAMEALSRDGDDWVRCRVAENRAAPAAAMEALSRDDYRWVRRNVAANPSAPAAVLEALSMDSDANVRCRVAANPSVPAAVLEALSRDADEWVRYYVAHNPSTPSSA